MLDSQFERARVALIKAKSVVGGGHALSREMTKRGQKISSQAIQKWQIVPPPRVLLVEKITGVKRGQLRPDFYPKS